MSYFYTASMKRWLGGYEPQVMDQIIAERKPGRDMGQFSQTQALAGWVSGKRFGTRHGSMVGLSAKADEIIRRFEAHERKK